MITSAFFPSGNPAYAPLDEIPTHDRDGFSQALCDALGKGHRLVALVGVPGGSPDAAPTVVAAVASDATGEIGFARLKDARSYPSVTAVHPEAHGLERALWEDWGIEPIGHPWLKPLRRTVDLDPAGGGNYFDLKGDEVHEVAVGPVHAGIIEPGHFRFMCHGETVHHLEIRLGYQYRGARRLLLGNPSSKWLVAAESITGDTAVGAATAHAMCLEALCGVEPGYVADATRALALELERIAYHVGDLGAIGNDVGFLPTAQFNGRIRGDFLNCLLTLAGNRHGRGLVRPGGVMAAPAEPAALAARVAKHFDDARKSVDLLLEAPTVMARLDQAGRLTTEDARALGIVGVAARASGLARDVRTTHPHGVYRFKNVPIALGSHGDVHARALIRSIELNRSVDLCLDLLKTFPAGSPSVKCGQPEANAIALAMVEGWRGELVHVRVTGVEGEVVSADVVDPSVHNWFGLALALRGQGISDFPLCNKSFNLAYAGHDL